jgi:hypothetical protein
MGSTALTFNVRVVALSALAILLVISVRLASAQPSTGPEGAQLDFWKWALTQGGLLVALLVVLWTYRRDSLSVLKAARSENALLMELVSKAVAAITGVESAIKEFRKDADNDRRHGDRRHER